MIDYCIVESNEIKSLAMIVREMILRGWKPQGGISMSLSSVETLSGDSYTHVACAQALVKDLDMSIVSDQ